MFKTLLIFLSILCLTNGALASDYLLYFEVQGIAGYSSALNKTIYYSMDPDAEMQKPSLGFDFIKRFSGASGDVATLAVQGRFALTVDDDNYTFEPQLYNAYLKVKTPGPYVWIGHNRPAFGLSAYFDSHGLLLRTLAMQGFGYDRDWGAGIYKDFSWGDLAASFTTASGMPVYFKGNYMAASRVSYGVLNQDNMNLGFSFGYGHTLETMGYELIDDEPREMLLVGADLTILRNNFEHRFDLLAGEWLDNETYALFYRFGVNLFQEGQLKVEAQPVYWKFGGDEDYQLSLCFSSQVTSDFTVRLGYTYDHTSDDNRVLLQLYYYRLI
jgi:hypothetical protein